MAVRRVALVSLAALLLAGCGSSAESVPLLTATEPQPDGWEDGSCYLWWGEGELIEDATAGTAVRQPAPVTALPVSRMAEAIAPSHGVIITLKWPMGYTARRSGGSVEVLDTRGQVVAVTGRKYRFWTSAWASPGPAYTGGPGCVEEIASFYGE